jgi:hypothetical protein
MDERNTIIRREGPAGVRPGLRGGPDVWEVVAVHRCFADVERTAEWLDQPASAVEIALAYYERHREEIDAWILENEEAAETARNAGRSPS